MFNYTKFNKEQTKGLAEYLLDISKASIIGTISVNTIIGDVRLKIFMAIINILVAAISLEFAMRLLKKLCNVNSQLSRFC